MFSALREQTPWEQYKNTAVLGPNVRQNFLPQKAEMLFSSWELLERDYHKQWFKLS